MEDTIVGWVHPGELHAMFVDSYLRSREYDESLGEGKRLAGWMHMHCSANISAGRNGLVDRFLDQTEAQWLIQIDTDMIWMPDAIHGLLAAADPVKAPIVGGLCFGLEADTGQIFPTLYDLGGTEDDLKFLRHRTFELTDLYRVTGTGAAFLLVHRSVFEAFRKRDFSKPYPYFQEMDLGGMRCGEDVTFCLRAGELGFPIHVNTNVQIGHIKPQVITINGYMVQLNIQEQRARQLADQETANG